MDVSVLKCTGESTGRVVTLPDEIFAVKPHSHAIYLDVRSILANRRQGTHKSKERGEVSGSRRKLRRQKGTGNARVGDIKSPLFRGGGRIFGPKPRDYGFKLNLKVKRLARRSALASQAQDGNILILESLLLSESKTRGFVAVLENLSLLDRKVLLVLPKPDRNIVLSSRNVKKVKVICADYINTYDLLNADRLLIVEEALESMYEKVV